jgi:hypothetical protein
MKVISSEVVARAMAMVTGATRFAGVANKSLEETEFKSAFIVNGDSIGYSFGDDDRPFRILKSFFAATSLFLSKAKVAKDSEAVALVLLDLTGNFKFAAIVKYNVNKENPDEPGNWDYSFTLNEEDLAEVGASRTVKKFLFSDVSFHSMFDKVAYDLQSIQFEQERSIYDACCLCIDTLYQILDNEAVEGQTVDLEIPGYFMASVETTGDNKTFAIVPDGHMKNIIKDDAALSEL